jgi:mycobactin salicyl-AMP ligase
VTLTTPDPLKSAAQSTLLDGFVPFPPERAAAYRAGGYWTGRPLDSVLRDAGGRGPDRVAVIDGAGSYTYAELDALADRAAAGFCHMGIAPGQRVLLQLPNSRGFAVALFALLRTGAIPVMCLPGHRLAELRHFAEVSQAVALVITDTSGGFDYRSMADGLVQTHPMQIITKLPTESDTGAAPSVEVDTASPALLLVSGGTTGAPKLIPRTHDDYVYNVTASAEVCGLTGDDVYLVALPAAHNFPLACPGLLGAMSVGATTVFTADPKPRVGVSDDCATRRHRHGAGARAGEAVDAGV